MKRRIPVKRIAAFVMAVTMLSVLTPQYNAEAATAYTKVTGKVKYGQSEARKVKTLVNSFRTGKNAWYWNERNNKKIKVKGLKKLKYDYGLEKVAMQRAAEIAIQFSHTRPDGRNCFTAYSDLKVTTWTAGENIAWGTNVSRAKWVNALWREDQEKYDGQGHRRNMLESGFTGIGVAHVIVGGSHFWVEEFGAYNAKYKKTKPADRTRKVRVTVNKKLITTIRKKKYIRTGNTRRKWNGRTFVEKYLYIPLA